MIRTTLLCMLICSGVAAAQEAPLPKIRYVDLDRAARAVSEGQAVAARVAKLRLDQEKQTAALLAAVREEQLKLVTQRSTLSAAEQARRGEAIRKRLNEASAGEEKMKQELAELEQREQAALVKRISATVSQLVKREGYLVLEEEQVAWARPEFNITEEVIQLHESAK